MALTRPPLAAVVELGDAAVRPVDRPGATEVCTLRSCLYEGAAAPRSHSREDQRIRSFGTPASDVRSSAHASVLLASVGDGNKGRTGIKTMALDQGPALKTNRVPSDIASRVAERIRNGEFEAGDYLIEGVLGRHYGVGRSSIRSALQELHLRGMVDAVHGKGWQIRQIDRAAGLDLSVGTMHGEFDETPPDRIVELLELRMSLEPTAAGLAADRAKLSEVRNLERLSAEYKKVDVGDVDALLASDENFHRALVRAAHNETILEVYEAQVVGKIREYRRRSYTEDNPKSQSDSDHELIVEAVRRGDPQLARRTTLLHLWTLYNEVKKNEANGRRSKDSITMFG